MGSATDSDLNYLHTHRETWQNKHVLRRIYKEQLYRPLLEKRAAGNQNLEIGSGPGFLQEIDPTVWRTDILHSPWVHCAADAHATPFADNTFDNVLGLDVIHHFLHPLKVLREVARILRPGGRLILVEPWITPFSRFIYTYLHHEGCDMKAQPWLDDSPIFAEDKKAFDGNPAIPYLLVKHRNDTLKESLPTLQLTSVQLYSSITYLLSGGFQSYNLMPNAIYPAIYSLEKMTQPVLAPLLGLRALLIWQKAADA